MTFQTKQLSQKKEMGNVVYSHKGIFVGGLIRRFFLGKVDYQKASQKRQWKVLGFIMRKERNLTLTGTDERQKGTEKSST